MMNNSAPLRTQAAGGAIKVAAWCATEELARTIRIEASALSGFALNVELRDGKHPIQSDAQVLILDLDLTEQRDLDLLTEILAKRGPSKPVVATAARADVGEVRRLMRLGVADFLLQPVTHADLEHALSSLLPRLSTAAPGSKTGAVITFLRPVGGTGATTVAAHVAFALAKTDANRRVALVDLDLQSGAVGLYLDIATDVGIINCLDRFQDIDAGLLKSVAVKHVSGIDVFVATPNRRPLDDYPPQALEKLLDTMCRLYDVIVVDTPPAWTEWHPALLAHTEIAAVVLQKTVANLRHGRDLVSALRDAHLGKDQIVSICNRVPQTWFARDISQTDTDAALGAKIDASIPSDYALVSEAANLGVHVSRIRAGSKFEKAIGALAADLDCRLAQRRELVAAANGAPAATQNLHLREIG